MDSNSLNGQLDHFFRHEYGKVVAHLTNRFGPENLELVQDAVQEAMLRGMQNWSFSGLPEKPTAWLVRVAQNAVIDELRKISRSDSFNSFTDEKGYEHLEPETISDEQARMMFACCHPELTVEQRLILILRVLGGLNRKEIAQALLKKEEAIAKAYTRAKQKFQKIGKSMELPGDVELRHRLKTVLQAIYLLFNEGYKGTLGDHLVRKDLCLEAMRLNKVLLDAEVTRRPMAHALMALLCYQAARFDARINSHGQWVLLKDQDRTKWDRELIQEGHEQLRLATRGRFLNEYYLQAAVAGLHCESPDFDQTDWEEILRLYDLQVRINPSPVVLLNRVVAVGYAVGFDAALEALEPLESMRELKQYYLLYAIKAEVLKALGRKDEALEALSLAIGFCANSQEKELFTRRSKEYASLD